MNIKMQNMFIPYPNFCKKFDCGTILFNNMINFCIFRVKNINNVFMFWGYSEVGTIYRVCFLENERFYQYREPTAQFPIGKNRISWLSKMCFWID